MFKNNNKAFETSGATVEWVDRETVKYTENDKSTLVWVDYEAGLLTSGRVLHRYSISKWKVHPLSEKPGIDTESRKKIEAAIIAYFNSRGVRCNVQS